MPTSLSSSAARPLWRRLLRVAAVVGLGLAVSFILALGVIGGSPVLGEVFAPFNHGEGIARVVLILVVLFGILLPLGLAIVGSSRGWLTWKIILAGWVAVAPVFGWLAWDDAVLKRSDDIDEFSPVFPGAEKSFAVLMRYSKQTPDDEAKAFDQLALTGRWASPSFTRDPATWLEFVAQNRAAIEADWTLLAPQRRWLAELNAFDRFGDLAAARPDANLPTFKVWRTLAQRGCAIATLQAVDGHGDVALATLLPLLEAGRKLQSSSRTLVRSMIGIVVERMCLETAGIVLDRSTVSPDSRQRLQAVITGDNASVMAGRLVLVDFMQTAPILSGLKMGEHLASFGTHPKFLRAPLNFLSALVLNPIASRNLFSDHVHELAALAEARELGKFQVRSAAFSHAILREPQIKNLGGRHLAASAMPAYQKVVESYWQTADLRAGLQRRLAVP